MTEQYPTTVVMFTIFGLVKNGVSSSCVFADAANRRLFIRKEMSV